MPTEYLSPRGLWLPLITPFRDGALDDASLKRLIAHYAAEPVDGFILAATTGEGLTLDDDETERLVAIVAGELARLQRKAPILLGLSGVDSRKMIKSLGHTAHWPIQGYLIASPYYVRPSQQGLIAHFSALADAAAHPIMLYNIPYRTGRQFAE